MYFTLVHSSQRHIHHILKSPRTKFHCFPVNLQNRNFLYFTFCGSTDWKSGSSKFFSVDPRTKVTGFLCGSTQKKVTVFFLSPSSVFWSTDPPKIWKASFFLWIHRFFTTSFFLWIHRFFNALYLFYMYWRILSKLYFLIHRCPPIHRNFFPWIHRKFLQQVFFCGSTDFSLQVFCNQTIFSPALLDADFGPLGRNQHPARLRERTLCQNFGLK